MRSKVLVFSALCLLCSCWGDRSSSQGVTEDIPMQPLDSQSEDLNKDSSRWRNSWRPWKIFNWGQSSMFNKGLSHSPTLLESDNGGHHLQHDQEIFKRLSVLSEILVQLNMLVPLQRPMKRSTKTATMRTLTRRDSSLLTSRRDADDKEENLYIARNNSTVNTKLISESTTSIVIRPKGSVRNELITMMFESMLGCIVESWDVIAPTKQEEGTANWDGGKTPSELTFTSKKKKKDINTPGKQSKTKRSRSKSEVLDSIQADPLQQIWWSSPDERAVIHFKNGNVYEGDISMKCMHGEGRYQWADGTIYLGQFKNNEILGKGLIQWKDDTWYEGEFAGNIRHGRGLFVDSRNQRSYIGEWSSGTKHGKGIINYSSSNNCYDGEWTHNVRHGFGSREYTSHSGYRGEWDKYVREGKGLMIWPIHDFYRGEWKNGMMSGYGIYIWNAFHNNSMSMPSLTSYRGFWQKGERHGYGVLNFGFGFGSHYKGEFKNNMKHGAGKFITNDGLILRDNKLFIDDTLGPMTATDRDGSSVQDVNYHHSLEPYKFDMCDYSVGVSYHIDQALKNIDNQAEIRTNIVNNFIDNNKQYIINPSIALRKEDSQEQNKGRLNLENIILFEGISLQKSLRCYETELKNIYYRYSTICNTEEIHFTPVLLRLFLWQFYYDCNVHEKGLNLIEIDRMFHLNPDWLIRNVHNPFEKIYFWQFTHSLISVAMKLYGKRQLPDVKPDTILASAFRTFMEKDALPGAGRRKGRLTNGFGYFVPLKGAYELYCSIGEPHTVREFLCAVRQPPHYQDFLQPALIDAPDHATPFGRNTYVYGDEMMFITDEPMPISDENEPDDDVEARLKLKLFNFGNLSTKAIIKIFSHIFPHMCHSGKIIDLGIELTFFEFFEAFLACAEESIRVKEEELRWREKFSMSLEGLRKKHTTSLAGSSKHHK